MPLNGGLRRSAGTYGAATMSGSAASCISPRLAYSGSPSFSSVAGIYSPSSQSGHGSSSSYSSHSGFSTPPSHGSYTSPLSTYSAGYSSPVTGGFSSPLTGGYSSVGYSSPSHGRGSPAPSLTSSGQGRVGSRPRSKLSYSGSLGRSTPRPRARSVHSSSPTTAGLNLSPALPARTPPRGAAAAAAAARAGRSPSLSSSLSSLSGRSCSSGYGSSGALSSHSNAVASECNSRTASRSNSVENGELDYKKLYEDAMVENDKLQQRLADALADMRDTKLHLDKSLQMSNTRLAAAESDKREKRAIERKLSEMEEELKAMEELKAENRRLRDENGALIRVISKLSK